MVIDHVVGKKLVWFVSADVPLVLDFSPGLPFDVGAEIILIMEGPGGDFKGAVNLIGTTEETR